MTIRRRDLLHYDFFYVLDHFFGRRAVNALFGGRRARRREAFIARVRSRAGSLRSVDRVRDLAPGEFVRRYLRTGTPVVFAGAASDWPCVRKWSLPYFEGSHGAQPIVVLPKERTTSGFAGTRAEETTRATTFDTSAAKPCGGESLAMRWPSVRMIRQPPA